MNQDEDGERQKGYEGLSATGSLANLEPSVTVWRLSSCPQEIHAVAKWITRKGIHPLSQLHDLLLTTLLAYLYQHRPMPLDTPSLKRTTKLKKTERGTEIRDLQQRNGIDKDGGSGSRLGFHGTARAGASVNRGCFG